MIILMNPQDHLPYPIDNPAEDGDDSFVDSDVSDDYNSDSVDYSAYGSSSGELEGSDSSPSSEEDSSDDASGRNCNGGFHNSCYLARARSVYMCIWKS